jgi:hypothetical protein
MAVSLELQGAGKLSAMRIHRHGRRGPMAGALVVGVFAVAGCISVPDEEEPQCKLITDCDQPAGEVCEEGVCWGDPPAISMAAIIGPPGDAKDLVPFEVARLDIPRYGLIPQLQLGTPVTFRGQVVRGCPMGMPSCQSAPVTATISVTRPSSFPGGPGFSLALQTTADGNFVMYLPQTRLGLDPPYILTIAPSDRGAARSSMFSADAEELAPRRMSLIATQDAPLVLRLPPVTTHAISGRMLDGNGVGLAGYRVVARGGWIDGESATEVSTVAVTEADGSYQLQLSDELIGKVVLRAEPPMTRPGTATVELAGVAPATVTPVNFRLPAAERAPQQLSLTVKSRDSGGQLLPADGISVRLRYDLLDAGNSQTSRYDVEGTTNSAGVVTLSTVPGVIGTNWTYRLSMLPPADSKLGAVYDQPMIVGAGGSPEVEIPGRVSITGVLLYGTRAMKGVTLSVRPSRTFLQSLDASKRTFVGEIAVTTATTSKTGEFVVWADQQIAGVPARYSLTLQPPESELVPSWTHAEEVSIPADASRTLNVGTIYAVDSANVHGVITNPGGRPVAKARVLIYKLDTSCLTDCNGTAQLIGRGVSDADGKVRMALPKDP